MTIKELSDKINNLGGELFLVGGAVRDTVIGCESHDNDYVVVGLNEDIFINNFEANRTGKQFPVFRLQIDDEEIEVALARKEEKTGEGHNGFRMIFNETISIEEDLIRRDVTMNAMAISMKDNRLVDPFHGKEDIQDKIIRATSEHFLEDPLRVLRVARQAAKFNFSVSEDTLILMNKCKNELHTLPYSRIWGEMEKALMTKKPSIFFQVLKDANVLKDIFPEIANLIGKTQPVEFHPEGDAFNHSMLVLDAVSNLSTSLEARFCALFHDIGKSTTPEELLPKHHGHDFEGKKIIDSWDSERFPVKLKKSASVVANRHMNILTVKKPGKILDNILDIKRNSSFEVMRLVTFVDSGEKIKFLEDDFVNKVLAKVEIPDELKNCGDGEKIAMFVRKVRIDRIRNLKNT